MLTTLSATSGRIAWQVRARLVLLTISQNALLYKTRAVVSRSWGTLTGLSTPRSRSVLDMVKIPYRYVTK